MSRRTSVVWKYFKIDEQSDNHAICTVCGERLGCKGGSTSTLGKHLKARHPQLHIEPTPPTTTTGSASGSTPSANVHTGSSSVITSYFTRPVALPVVPMNRQREEDFKEVLVSMIVRDLRPISSASGSGFREVVEFLHPGAPKIGYKSLVNRVSLRFHREIDRIKSELSSTQHVGIQPCLTTDAWTSNENESFMAVTLHVVNKDWQLGSYLISLMHLPDRHTTDNLREALEAVLSNWGVDAVFGIVSDHAANITLAIKSCPKVKLSVHCFGHTCQLALNCTIQASRTVQHALASLQSVAHYFRKSVPAWNVLKEIQQREITRKKQQHIHEQQRVRLPMRPIMDCETRWNSKIFMAERMIALEPSIILAAQDPEIKRDMLNANVFLPNNEQWAVAKTIVALLKPFAEQVTSWSGQRYHTLSSVYPMIYSLLDLLKPDPKNEMLAVEELKQKLTADIIDRFEINKPPFPRVSGLVASLLDPRFKSLPFLTDDENWEVTELAEYYMMTSAFYTQSTSMTSNPTAEVSESVSSVTLSASSGLFVEPSVSRSVTITHSTSAERSTSGARHKKLKTEHSTNLLSRIYTQASSEPSTGSMESFHDQLERYISGENAPLSQNPLEWWKSNEHLYPQVAVLAAQLFSLPATSCPSERVFSNAGNSITKKRAQLNPEHAEMLVFLFENTVYRTGQLKMEDKNDSGSEASSEASDLDSNSDSDSNPEPESHDLRVGVIKLECP